MKTKQAKEDLDKSTDEDTLIEPKTRARKKASDIIEDDKTKPSDEPKTSKDPKKTAPKPKAVVKKRPLGIRKALRSKKASATVKKVTNVIKQTAKRGRKPAKKIEPANSQDTGPLIPPSEIKKEPVEETSPNSRSSSPKTAGRRPRVSSDMMMMKSVLADSPTSVLVGARTSPYPMRSERSNSPSTFEAKNLRSGKPRKVKSNLLNEVVLKEQKKRRRLLSDSKPDSGDGSDDCKKLKRGRSCSRDGSEISKCSDITESDISEPPTDTDKELNKKSNKPKTDLDLDIETNIRISSDEKVPSLGIDSKLAETKPRAESSSIIEKTKKKINLSLKRSTSLDSDNNNSNRIKLENLNSSDIEDKLLMKTDNDTLFEDRSSILNSMSKTFNSKDIFKTVRKSRRGGRGKAVGSPRSSTGSAKNGVSGSVTDIGEEQVETSETLCKEIADLINVLDKNINDQELDNEIKEVDNATDTETKPSQKLNLTKPLGDVNIIVAPDPHVKEKEVVAAVTIEASPAKTDEGENIKLHYEEDSIDKSLEITKVEITANIPKLMGRLKEFEEFDKIRQRQEIKPSENKQVMVGNDVVLIPKSGADVRQLKDIQSVKSPERAIEKENLLSCFENNSAISILKRDQSRKSIDIDLPNSVTLIKRNSVSSRKESTSSNHSREADAISIFEKSLGKDVTLTEIKKSADKQLPPTQPDLNQLATLQPTKPTTASGMGLDSSQISITPRIISEHRINSTEIQITKRKSLELHSRKSSDSEDKMAVLEKIKSPPHLIKSSAISITPTPVAVKSPEVTPMETEALAPPLEIVKIAPSDIMSISKEPKPSTAEKPVETIAETPKNETEPVTEVKPETAATKVEPKVEEKVVPKVEEKVEPKVEENDVVPTEVKDVVKETKTDIESLQEDKNVAAEKPVAAKPTKARDSKSARNSIESQPGPSNMLLETPESQKRKENVLRTLGLLTLKAANEAKIEKMKEKERIYSLNKGKSKSDYTGTLKTVIKLNRSTGDREKKKYRNSLKMTFKSKNRGGKPSPEVGEAIPEEDAFYTIERREGAVAATSEGGHKKSHYSNRLNTHVDETAPEPELTETLNLVIPEKASSFSIHPGRVCMDTCFYCGGKFGLYDTPCHIAQMKSSERQKKVLVNEEKLTVDSCLCDACYRHVDRRANCPSYRRRPPKMHSPPLHNMPSDKPIATSPPLDEESEEETSSTSVSAPTTTSGRPSICHTEGCTAVADRSIRRKWLIKMRTSVNKVLQLRGDYPGLHTIPLCSSHHGLLSTLRTCALCGRDAPRLHAQHGHSVLNPILKTSGVPVELTDMSVLCKLCRYYCNLLTRPGENDQHARGYRKKLLQIHKVEVPPELEHDKEDESVVEECNSSRNKVKKSRTKSKQRKSSDPDKLDRESSEQTTESSSPEKEKEKTEIKQQHLEEDIESLISSNKIPVPTKQSEPAQSDGSEIDSMDVDTQLTLPLDKQTELQYLLQKQNNPAQFLHGQPNLTLKHKNILSVKVQNAISTKPGHQHRIHDKNAKRIQKIGQMMVKEKLNKTEEEVPKDGMAILKNLSLNEECTIESIPTKKPADIATLKNKWQMSESFSQVKRNLSELSKKLPAAEKDKKIDNKYSNPVKRLETNPSISVRELFPGEEEMNLQCNIEFNNVKGITPEGWEKCSSIIQYDVETKKLWTELQRPYGNQSSFLRHMILLEKYFRSGDLVLSHNATPNAANYSDSVQSRLRAYDNVVTDAPRRSEPAISLMVTDVPKKPEQVSLIEFRKKPSVNGKSLLKANNTEDKEPKKIMPPPAPTLPKPKSKSEKLKNKPLPPELIAINAPNSSRKAMHNVLHNIQQLVKGVTASDPIEVASAPLPAIIAPPVTIQPKIELKEKKEVTKETPKKRNLTSKPWRPTLMPITPENLAKIAQEPTQEAVDGRKLPSLVQVMSSGKRYHITLQDYNKMCIMRREKLQQLQNKEKPKKKPEETTKNIENPPTDSTMVEQWLQRVTNLNKDGKKSEDTTLVTEIQPSAMLGNGGTLMQNISNLDKESDKKEMPELNQISSNAATILKSVGLKNITIAPIPAKTATVTSHTITSPSPAAQSLFVTSTPIKLPQLGPAVSITSEMISPGLPIIASNLIMPKIPKSLTVIPQTVMTSSPVLVPVTSSSAADGQKP